MEFSISSVMRPGCVTDIYVDIFDLFIKKKYKK